MDEFAAWLTGKVKEQEAKPPHEDPAFASQEVTSWLDRLKKVKTLLGVPLGLMGGCSMKGGGGGGTVGGLILPCCGGPVGAC